MSTQEFVRNKSSIGKWLFIGAIGVWGVHLMLHIFDFLFFHFDIIDDFRYAGTYIYIILIIFYLLLAYGAAYFYLMRAQPQVAARVWGILGALTLTLSPLMLIILIAAILELSPVAIIAFLIMVGGPLLAVKKPELAGILMLISALGSGAWGAWQIVIVRMIVGMNGFLAPGPEAILLPFVAAPFLAAGGILAFSRQREKPVSRKMALGLIGVSLIVPLYFLVEYFIF